MPYTNTAGHLVHMCKDRPAENYQFIEIYFSRLVGLPVICINDEDMTFKFCPFCSVDLRMDK